MRRTFGISNAYPFHYDIKWFEILILIANDWECSDFSFQRQPHIASYRSKLHFWHFSLPFAIENRLAQFVWVPITQCQLQFMPSFFNLNSNCIEILLFKLQYPWRRELEPFYSIKRSEFQKKFNMINGFLTLFDFLSNFDFDWYRHSVLMLAQFDKCTNWMEIPMINQNKTNRIIYNQIFNRSETKFNWHSWWKHRRLTVPIIQLNLFALRQRGHLNTATAAVTV